MKTVQAACPSSSGDVPRAGIWALAVQMIQEGGGTTLTDKFLPARATVVREVVERNGTWDFVTECMPCKAEDEAIKQENDETERALREWGSRAPADRQK